MFSPPAYAADALIRFAEALFRAAGLNDEMAHEVAEVLVEGDLLGHDTHGLALAALYMEEIEAGAMTRDGGPDVLSDSGAAIVWDGRMLPGPWLTRRAVRLACDRAQRHGLAAVSVRRSHHIACLMAYLSAATERGLMLLIATSDPADASVAPFGGLRAVFTPDPIAVGIPTERDPILIDLSSSITTNAMTQRLRRKGERFPGTWAIDAEGRPSDDPAVVAADPPGTLLPAGGLDHGHKGYGLALTVEALTQGLAGHGRADRPTGWGAGVFVQALDPAAFGGTEAFRRQIEWIAEACRSNPPRPGVERVRLPGERSLALRRQALAQGLRLRPEILDALAPSAKRFGVPLPQPVL
jgi:LDH2 family malate/lactate/ureidoglycolate dehydrogenase